jgi:methionine-gamma-lyase
MASEALHPESLLMSLGYQPAAARGAVKPPLYLSSTYGFETAEAGIAAFEHGQVGAAAAGEQGALIYSRLSHPNLDLVEQRVALMEEAESAAVFESGMAAISTALLAFVRPGDAIAMSTPLYSGTDYYVKHILPDYGVGHIEFGHRQSGTDVVAHLHGALQRRRLSILYLETPANPTNSMLDIAEVVAAVRAAFPQVVVMADNTYMGPLWQKPLTHGCDIVLYSATKYMAGHSFLLAGAAAGRAVHINPIKRLRTFLGTTASPHTSWLLARSMETMPLRMERQQATAHTLAHWLQSQPGVKRVWYPTIQQQEDPWLRALMQRQCTGTGAMIAIELQGSRKQAYAFLNALQLVKLAVSLGSTESLAQHPATMTHRHVPTEVREAWGITEGLIRFSVGIEHPEDLMHDLEQALYEAASAGS